MPVLLAVPDGVAVMLAMLGLGGCASSMTVTGEPVVDLDGVEGQGVPGIGADPFDQVVVLGIVRVRHGPHELRITRHASAIFRRRCTGTAGTPPGNIGELL